jgi:hypothetical protein
MQRDVDLVGRALELDARDTRAGELFHDHLANGKILMELLGVVPLGVPLGIPIADDAQSKTDRIYFTSH